MLNPPELTPSRANIKGALAVQTRLTKNVNVESLLCSNVYWSIKDAMQTRQIIAKNLITLDLCLVC